MKLTYRLRFRDACPRLIAAPQVAARDRFRVSEPSCPRAIMAAAVYTISSSPPVRRSHGSPSGNRVAPGGLATEPACAGPHIRHARSVPFERSGAAACFKAATRPPGCRRRKLRPGGWIHA